MNRLIFIISISLNILQACAVCYGAPDHPVTQGLNKAILFMLGTVAFVLSCILYSIFSMIRRNRNIKTEGV